MTQAEEIQEIVIDYFKNVDDETMVHVINAFVYNKPTSQEHGVSELVEKFINDNGLKQAYVNYLIDIRRGATAYFLKSSGSELEIIEQVKIGLLNLAFNRFRKIPKQPKPPKLIPANKVQVLGTSEIEESVHIVCNINSNYAICSILFDCDSTGDYESTTDKVDCKDCISIAKMCKSIEL